VKAKAAMPITMPVARLSKYHMLIKDRVEQTIGRDDPEDLWHRKVCERTGLDLASVLVDKLVLLVYNTHRHLKWRDI
jgi:hypothetical protein